MSCTVFALPYALAWVIGAVVAGNAAAMAGAASSTADIITEMAEENRLFTNEDLNNMNIQAPCDDITVISDKHFIEKSFETAFMDKNILFKTLEEHGVNGITENEYGKITGTVDNYTLDFEKTEPDKPYYLRILCLDTDNAEEKLGDLSSEYALNVQEEAYLNIVEKLKENNMQIEEEEVTDDNTIVLTVNLD